MTIRRTSALILVAAVLLAALAYLRDPPWLVNVTSGLTAWETDADGSRYRWTGGRASFFVPADAGTITLHVRSATESPSAWPTTATVTIDDRPAEIIRFNNERWRAIRLRLPPPGRRAVRRVDIRLDRLPSGQRGIQLGVVEVEHGSSR